MDVYHVVIECPNTGRATRTGVELADLSAFDYVALLPETCRCQHCNQSHVWSRKDAWVERHQGSRVRVRTVMPRSTA